MALDSMPGSLGAMLKAGGPPPISEIPYFKEIVQGVRFSRAFVKTYVLLCVLLLVLFTIAAQLRSYSRRRQYRAEYLNQTVRGWTDYGSFGLSPGLRKLRQLATLYPKGTGIADEETPKTRRINGGTLPQVSESSRLLGESRQEIVEGSSTSQDVSWPSCSSTSLQSTFWTRATLYLRGVLTYQPPSVLGYECPTVSAILILTLYYGVCLFYALYNVPFHQLKMFVFADRMGLLFIVNLPILYLMAAKAPILRILTGWSYERVNFLHRAVGRVCIFAAVFHLLGMTWVWWSTLTRLYTLKEFLAISINTYGLIAWCSFMLLGLTSKEEFRNAFYEAFLFSHVALQLLALVFLYLHHSAAKPYALASITIFTLDRILYRMIFATTCMPGTVTVLPDGATVKVSLTPPKDYAWTAGDHAFFRVSSVSFQHPHPFSILSPPPPHSSKLEFLIRVREGFSRKLRDYAQTSVYSDITAVVDGTYGSSSALKCLEDSSCAIGVAGGSGIAVIYPLLHHFAITRRSADPERIATPDGKLFELIWIIREESHRDWLRSGQLDELAAAGVTISIRVTGNGANRPNLKQMLGYALKPKSARTGVVVCGPGGMVRDVRNCCSSAMMVGADVKVVAEKFGW